MSSAEMGDKIDEKDEDEFIFCDLCNLCFNNVKTYELHITGTKHLKKEKTLKNKEILGKAGQISGDDATIGDDNNEIVCKVCDITCSGIVPFKQHLKSGPHAKALKRQELIAKQFVSVDDDNDEAIEDPNSDSESLLIPKPYAICSLCKKQFFGPESFRDHIVSKTHKKKRKEAKYIEQLRKSTNLAGAEDKNDDKNPMAEFDFNKMSSLKQQLLETAEDTLSDEEQNDDRRSLSCKQCGKSFSGPAPLLQHLVSKLHKKKLKQLQILTELKSKMSSDDDDNTAEEDESGTDDEEETEEEILACVTCSMSFSGPESMMDHLKSKGHKKKVSFQKAKAKILKDLSEQGVIEKRKGKLCAVPSAPVESSHESSQVTSEPTKSISNVPHRMPCEDEVINNDPATKASSSCNDPTQPESDESKKLKSGETEKENSDAALTIRKKRSNFKKVANAVIEIINDM